MTDLSEHPLFHLTPQEVHDLFEEGVEHGINTSNCAWDCYREHLIKTVLYLAQRKRHKAGEPMFDPAEHRRAIEAMFEGVE
jgi:hypothetical protein